MPERALKVEKKSVAIRRDVADEFEAWLLRKNASRLDLKQPCQHMYDVMSDVLRDYIRAHAVD